MPKTTLLCGKRGHPNSVTVADYEAWELEADNGWSKKPAFIRKRLRERFVEPVEYIPVDQKNGFMIMALSCLLIETLEAFHRGWPSTKDKSKEAFRLFFRRQQRFRVIQDSGMADEFYTNIRCGLLHQGETIGGWAIVRSHEMFNPVELRINATQFHRTLALAIDDYRDELGQAPAGSKLRKRFDGKMTAVIANCG